MIFSSRFFVCSQFLSRNAYNENLELYVSLGLTR